MILICLNKFRNGGLLFLRIGLGCMFLYHGFPKIAGGPEFWHQLGLAMGYLGIHAFPTFWGFMAACAEFFGGFFLIIGLLFRPACMLLVIDLIVAMSMHFSRGQGLHVAGEAVEDAIVFFSLIFIGPGRYSIDEWWYAMATRNKKQKSPTVVE